ncbi:ATP-dependent DNA helicase pif1-like [Osmia bicornis bicornis]|uniref:ATP-dependent DNA helicase pif1-like n=1 Tax=Osmia bicornis bicornis TaxID=1437191 RepID=UPI001EAF6A58|nr:ATP-dependent DNA helicase pif1-like [Osmia bicornis bicornis]
MARKPFPRNSSNISGSVLELKHTDVCGPMQTMTPSHKRYLLTLIDDYSRYTVMYLLRHKSEVAQRIQEYIQHAKTKFNKTPKVFRSDRGTEFVNKDLKDLFSKEAMLTTINSEEVKLVSRDTLDCVEYLKKRVHKHLDKYEEDNSQTGGLHRIITVKLGAKVMLMRNIDVTLGLINGTIGKIVGFLRAPDSEDINTVQFRLSTSTVHSLQRITSKFQIMDKAYVLRYRFPISLSYVITIHKWQRLSVKTVVVDIGNSIFSCGQAYVALSRVTTLNGLHIINFDSCMVKANTLVIQEYNRLRSIYRPDLAALKFCCDSMRRMLLTRKSSDVMRAVAQAYVGIDVQILNSFAVRQHAL